MEKALLLLCQNREVYRGPFIPVRRAMRGAATVKGLQGGDLVHVFGVQEDREQVLLGELSVEVQTLIFNPKLYEYLRAIRVHSEGSPIDVWVS